MQQLTTLKRGCDFHMVPKPNLSLKGSHFETTPRIMWREYWKDFRLMTFGNVTLQDGRDGMRVWSQKVSNLKTTTLIKKLVTIYISQNQSGYLAVRSRMRKCSLQCHRTSFCAESQLSSWDLFFWSTIFLMARITARRNPKERTSVRGNRWRQWRNFRPTAAREICYFTVLLIPAHLPKLGWNDHTVFNLN